jgi:uncharacterized protein (TIGR00725 family)
MKKTISVFGSSLPKEGEEEFASAYRLGELLAQREFNIMTGGYKGIMEAVSKGVIDNGGEATGITLSYVKYTPNKYLTNEIKSATLFERIETLIYKADGYIILEGGTGTLLELAAVWEFMNKNLLEKKPIACHSLMWKEIGKIIDGRMEKENRVTGLVRYFDTVDEIADYMYIQLNQ